MGIGSIFKKIFSPIAKLFKRVDLDKVDKVLDRIGDLSSIALDVAEKLSSITPTTTDDEIVRAAKSLKMDLSQVLLSTSDFIRDGSRQHLAAQILKKRLIDIVTSGKSVKIGNEVLNSIADVIALDKTILLSAVQNAYAIYKLASTK